MRGGRGGEGGEGGNRLREREVREWEWESKGGSNIDENEGKVSRRSRRG